MKTKFSVLMLFLIGLMLFHSAAQAAPKPTATTGSATSVTSSSATLNGTVNPTGFSTTAYFQWGTTASYGNNTASQSIGSGRDALSIKADLTGLKPSTIYHYRIVATNTKGGTAYGSDRTFTTAPSSTPTAATVAATSVTSSSATLNGTVNPHGLATTAYFQWGTTTSYGHNTASQSIGSGTSALSVSAGITGLTAGITYHYRIVANNSSGTTYGADKTFTTSQPISSEWSKSFGSTSNDSCNSVTIDGYGNVLMTGSFYGVVDFGGGPLESTHLPWIDSILVTDAVLAKYSPAGDHLWSKNLGGASNESGMAIATDAYDNVIVTGSRSSDQVNYDGGVGIGIGYADVFLAKFSPTGEYLWSGVYGGINSEYGSVVAVDHNGDILLSGYFMGTASFGGAAFTSSGSNDIFVAKYSGVNGSHLWSKRLGGVNSDSPSGIAIDSANNVFITGKFAGIVDFGGGPLTSAGGYDIFLVKFSPSGTHMWSKKLGGTGNDTVSGAAIDSSNRVILTGAFEQTVNFGGGSLTSAGSGDIFIAKYDGTNGAHIWSQRYGGPNDELSKDVAVDTNDNVIVTGNFIGPVSFGGEEVSSIGTYDAFVAKYSTSGTYIWSEVYAGPNGQMATSVAVSGNSNIAITGYFVDSLNFGGINHVSNGNADIFLLSIMP